MTTTIPYASVDEADAYFQAQLYADAWDSATPEERQKAMLHARRVLDRHVTWCEVWVDPPEEIKEANMLLALELLSKNVEARPDRIKRKRIEGVVDTEYQLDANNRNSVLPDAVIALIGPFGTIGPTVGHSDYLQFELV